MDDTLVLNFRAKKRAEWRAARLKSLEQDTLQAQMILKSMSEVSTHNEDLTDASKTIKEVGTCCVYFLFFRVWGLWCFSSSFFSV